MRKDDNRWTKRMTEWQPRCGKRGRGRQKLRWRDDITSYAGTTWTRLAQDRKQWKNHEEGYIQQWMNTAWWEVRGTGEGCPTNDLSIKPTDFRPEIPCVMTLSAMELQLRVYGSLLTTQVETAVNKMHPWSSHTCTCLYQCDAAFNAFLSSPSDHLLVTSCSDHRRCRWHSHLMIHGYYFPYCTSPLFQHKQHKLPLLCIYHRMT